MFCLKETEATPANVVAMYCLLLKQKLYRCIFLKHYIIKSCSSNVVFCRMVNDYCRNGKMVTIFMPMYHVSMIFDPVENIVAVNIITSIYIWMKQTCQKLLTEPFQCIDADDL